MCVDFLHALWLVIIHPTLNAEYELQLRTCHYSQVDIIYITTHQLAKLIVLKQEVRDICVQRAYNQNEIKLTSPVSETALLFSINSMF